MRVEIVAVGNELLNGDLVDSNTARLARLLRAHGLSVQRSQAVPDTLAAVQGALADAASHADLVLVSGGLGPTGDDLTIEAAARWAGVPLVEDADILARLRERFASRGFPFTPNNAKQALVPAGATPLNNAIGTAPGVRMHHGGATLFFFPGVPHELDRLAADHLVPWLAASGAPRAYRSRAFKTFGKTESQVATLLDGLTADPRVHVAYRAHFPEIHVSLHVTEPDAGAADALLDDLGAKVRDRLGPIVFTEDPGESFAAAIGRLLLARGATLATAESCTGGLVGAMVTEVSGASAWFLQGIVTYANAAKVSQLGVPADLIAAHGAVSEPVARAMAEGARRVSGATLAVAVTGIAGPTGGTEDKPVGTVHLALATPEGTRHVMRRFPFDRARNRTVSAFAALELVRGYLSGA